MEDFTDSGAGGATACIESGTTVAVGAGAGRHAGRGPHRAPLPNRRKIRCISGPEADQLPASSILAVICI